MGPVPAASTDLPLQGAAAHRVSAAATCGDSCSDIYEGSVDVGRGIRLSFDAFGNPTGIPIILIAGLGQQKHAWPPELVEGLTGRGFRVIRFDNRDAGRSTHLPFPAPNLVGILRGGSHRLQYHLGDFACDTVGLAGALGYSSVHVVGVSMGGMIAQTMAAHFPGTVRTLTSISSTTGARHVGRPALSTQWRLARRQPRNQAEAMDHAVKLFRHIGSRGYDFDEQRVRHIAALEWERDPTVAGRARQFAAIFNSGDRTAELGDIDVPTLVLHGDRDPMVHPSGGPATCAAIRGARLHVLRGLGHDLPAEACPLIAALISDHVSSVERTETANFEKERS